MPKTILARLLGLGSSTQNRPQRRPMQAVPRLEVLEDRLALSGGHGGGQLVGAGSSGGSNAPAAVRAFKLDDTGPPVAAGVLLSELFSGYPIRPGTGPFTNGGTVVLTDPSSFPVPMGDSGVALVPVLLTTSITASGSTAPTPGTLTLLNPVTHATFTIGVTITPAPPAAGH